MADPRDLQIHVLDMELNGGCNYKCQMCPQSRGREKSFLKKLPIELLEKAIDDAQQYGLTTVSLHGGGEPTLNRDFAKCVRLVKSRGLRCVSITNALRLTPELSAELVDAGIDVLRVSAIGYDAKTYSEWMRGGDYELVRSNVRAFVSLAGGTASQMHLNHLILDKSNVAVEAGLYRQNWGEYTGAHSEIWMMHNWSGSDDITLNYKRKGDRRTCGRPFAPELQVRAGGIDGQKAAVVACCMVLGQDSKAVMGHLDTQTIAEVVASPSYEELRAAHREGRFDDIEVCKNCDQLYDAPESLVWSDIPGRSYKQSKNLDSLKYDS